MLLPRAHCLRHTRRCTDRTQRNTPLFAAANRPPAVNLLMEKGANVHAKGLGDSSVLHWVVHYGDVGIIQKLLAKHVDIEAMDQEVTLSLL